MTKNQKKKAPKTKGKSTKAGGRTIRIRISASKATTQNVEEAIADKLATQPTDLFRDRRKIILVIEKFGGRPE